MSKLRLLHLSDPHLAKSDLFGAEWSEYFKNPFIRWPGGDEAANVAVLTAYERKKQFDAIIVSGDLANTGLRRDLERARLFVTEKNTREGAKTKIGLGIINKPSIIMPGNHDRYIHKGAVAAGGAEFDEVFGELWGVGQGVKTVRLSENPPVTAVIADLTLQGETSAANPRSWVEAYGNGRVYTHSVAQLNYVTQEAFARGDYVIWVIHFAPWFSGLGSLLKLLDEEKLPLRSGTQRVSHVLCGHTHIPRRYRVEGVEIICAGSCTKDGKSSERKFPCSFLILELEGVGETLTTTRCQHFEWNDAVNDFVDSGNLPVTEEHSLPQLLSAEKN
jgi:3',5'-cyclic AMP phosphodiesterase CpdA